MDDDDDIQVYKDDGNALLIAYQSGYFDGKKAALAGREWNFCERCGKRTADLTTIHTCTPPQRTWVGLTPEELNMIGDSMRTWNSWSITDVYTAIEAKLKEKNT